MVCKLKKAKILNKVVQSTYYANPKKKLSLWNRLDTAHGV